jgi:EAL domain-containing protein (putative c-di-GMP-specific phosphodiesterase class I)
MLISESDADCVATLQRVAGRLGCDRVEVASAGELDSLLSIRHPTLAVIAVDGIDSDGLKLLSMLAQHEARPATLLVGNQDERVLAGVQRMAAARGLPVIGVRQRPLAEGDVEQLLLDHVIAPLPITRAELEQALAEQEFLLEYQPKVSLGSSDMQIIGVEALVRWRHPRRGTLLPRHFLSAVEQHGLLMALADFVITEAVRQIGAWNNLGIRLEIAVNLSPRLVRDRAFPDRLAALLREYDVPPAQVTLDVTETAGAQDRELIQDVFTRLRVMGLGLSLDNFGTGLSSLSELYRTPFSEIKVDRLLLEDALRERDAELVVRAVVGLAHQLRLKVCAEGVETAQALEFIRSAGFDTAQGRLFSEPVDTSRIEALLAKLAHAQTAGTGVWRSLQSRRPARTAKPAAAPTIPAA